MRRRTSGCSTNNHRLLNRGPGVIPCPKLYLNVIILLKILSLCVPGWERACWWGRRAEVSVVTAGRECVACWGVKLGCVPAWPQALSLVFALRQIDWVSSTPSRESCAKAPKMCWSWVREQYSCTGISLWLWWPALLLNWVIQMWQHAAVALLLLGSSWCVRTVPYHAGGCPGTVQCLQNASKSCTDNLPGLF